MNVCTLVYTSELYINEHVSEFSIHREMITYCRGQTVLYKIGMSGRVEDG